MALAKIALSGSTGGRGIKVVATATAGTLLHATGVSATIQDEVWLFAVNSDASDRKLTIEFGDVASPDDTIEVTVPAEGGLQLIVPGLILYGTGAAARNVRAFAASTNVVVVFGFVNRYTP